MAAETNERGSGPGPDTEPERDADGTEAFVPHGAERETVVRPPSDAPTATEDYHSRRAWKIRCPGCAAVVPAGEHCLACGDALPKRAGDSS